jgi:hypothetical protein
MDVTANLVGDLLQDSRRLQVGLGRLRSTSKRGSLFEFLLRLELALAEDTPWS